MLEDDSYGVKAGVNAVSVDNISIPSTYNGMPITTIEANGFSNLTELKSISIPSSVTSIGESAFENCSSLTLNELPENLVTIGAKAFSGCSSIQSIVIPKNVTIIEESAFSGCNSMQNVEFKGDLEYIGDSAFSSCTGLVSVVLPNTVSYLGKSSFSNCSNLEAINIPTSVVTLKSYWLSGTNISTLTIPANVKEIEPGGISGDEYVVEGSNSWTFTIQMSYYTDVISHKFTKPLTKENYTARLTYQGFAGYANTGTWKR